MPHDLSRSRSTLKTPSSARVSCQQHLSPLHLAPRHSPHPLYTRPLALRTRRHGSNPTRKHTSDSHGACGGGYGRAGGASNRRRRAATSVRLAGLRLGRVEDDRRHDESHPYQQRGRGDDAGEGRRHQRGDDDGGWLGVRVEDVVGVLEGSGDEEAVERLEQYDSPDGRGEAVESGSQPAGQPAEGEGGERGGAGAGEQLATRAQDARHTDPDHDPDGDLHVVDVLVLALCLENLFIRDVWQRRDEGGEEDEKDAPQDGGGCDAGRRRGRRRARQLLHVDRHRPRDEHPDGEDLPQPQPLADEEEHQASGEDGLGLGEDLVRDGGEGR
mmetsp:Transcript_19806/g.64564  ORF Transcript_19806/g.64564 Transcript_19806/m.64564 type:complete len:328 (-) Transcript_19806:539-1522(-)